MADAAVLQRPVRIATFNLHHAAPPGRTFTARGLKAAVQQLDVDLLALQEVDCRVSRSQFSDQAAIVARATGLHPVFVAARPLGPLGRYGIALCSAEPARAVEVVRLPSFGMEQRVAIIASVRLGGVAVSVAAMHLQNRKRVAAAQIDVVLDRLMARPGPHIVMGDLNAGPELLGRSMAGHGLVRVESPPTFPTRAATDSIDWIALKGLSVRDADVPDVWLSDHFPLVATVE